MSATMRVVVYATAVACGLTGGVLFGFSSLVMPALRAVPVREGVAAMQAINAAARRSWFMVPLMGSAVGCVATGVYAVFAGHGHGRGLLLVGATAGLSVMAVTAGYHVPRNDVLAQWDPQAGASSVEWLRWVSGWTRWNHIRTGAALVAALALAAGASGITGPSAHSAAISTADQRANAKGGADRGQSVDEPAE